MCVEEQELVHYFLVHCHQLSSLWHLALFTLAFGSLHDVFCLGAIVEGQRCVDSLEKKDEKMFGFWSLEDHPYGYLVDYLEGKKPTDF